MKKQLFLFVALIGVFLTANLFGAFYPVNGGRIDKVTYETTALSSTTLVATSNQVRIFSGTEQQIEKFPNATLLPNDWWYLFINNSSSFITVRDSSNAFIASVNAGRIGYFYLKDNSSAAGTWNYNTPAAVGDIITDHGQLTGLADDDHPQYHNDARGDARYFTKAEHLTTSAGAADSGKPIVLNGSGLVDNSMLPSSVTSGWGTSGNAGLTGTDFLGSTDDNDVIFKRNSNEYMRLDDSQILISNHVSVTGNVTVTGNLNLGKAQYHALLSDGSGNVVTGSVFGYDYTNKRYFQGIPPANASYAWHFKAPGTSFTDGLALEGDGAGSARLWNLYPDSTGFLYLRNPGTSTTAVVFDNNGQAAMGGGSPGAQVHIRPYLGSVISQIIASNSGGQTADLLQIQDPTGANVFSVSASGYVTAGAQFDVNGPVRIKNLSAGIVSSSANGTLSIAASTGTGALVFGSSPTLSNPTISNLTGGVVTSSTSGVLSVMASTGSGSAVLATSPTMSGMKLSDLAGGIVTSNASGVVGALQGTAGGIPYYGTTTVVSSSAALSRYQVVLGGGSGGSPTTVSGTGTSGQVLTSNGSSAAPTWQTASAGSSFVKEDYFLGNGVGHGSGNTKVRRYSNVRMNRGTKLTITQDSTNGDSMTANAAGAYMFCAADTNSGGAGVVAITVNGSALTTNATTPLTYAQGLRAIFYTAVGANYIHTCWFGILAQNDVVRVQDDGANNATDAGSYFFGTYLGSGTSDAYLGNGSGHGSTATKVRTFTNIRSNAGSALTITQDATNGDKVVTNSNGVYAACYGDTPAAADVPVMGITVGASLLTTNISSYAYSDGLRAYFATATTNDEPGNICWVGYLPSGSTLRAQDIGTNAGTASTSYFFVTQLSSETSDAYASNGTGHGSVSTKIRNLSTLQAVNGYDMQYMQSSVFGDGIKVATEGSYAFCYSDRISAGKAVVGLALNPTQVTTNASSLTYLPHGLRSFDKTNTTGRLTQSCWGGSLNTGDVVQPVDDGANNIANEREVIFFGAKTR